MYRKAFTGSGLKICLDTACIKDNGYVKSPNYPICSSQSQNATISNPSPTNNTTNTTTNTGTSCYSKLENVPAKCNGGTIQSDNFNGCRNMVCSNGGSSITVMSCNKPNSGAPQYYEMYRQVKTGTDILELCLANTCIKDNGYAKSGSYPVCIAASGSSPSNSAPVIP